MSKLVLCIETSCDETAAAVVCGETLKILSNVVYSQIPLHSKYGGVVPEIASRNHVKVIDQVVGKALDDANVKIQNISDIAATTHPGLPGAVLVGRIFGEALTLASGTPFHAVNHIHGHIASVPLSLVNHELRFLLSSAELASQYSTIRENLIRDCLVAHLALVVSGGHTALYKVAKGGKVTLIEQTLDDAVGEAFDKVARVLGLPYPGGPSIENEANKNLKRMALVNFVAKPNYKIEGFSYSGLKTAVLNYVNRLKQRGEEIDVPYLAASFQSEAVSQIVYKVLRALKMTKIKTLYVSGGVSANEYLRMVLKSECESIGVKIEFPDKFLCGDNAAMIGASIVLGVK